MIQKYYLAHVNPKRLADLIYSETFGNEKSIDWNHPKDLNEKINWMKFNTDTSKWSYLADKYAVRKYVKEKIGDDYLVPLLGMWSSPKDIDFSTLPNSFVLKSNNGAGTVMLVKDKSTMDERLVRKTLAKWLRMRFGMMRAEPHYSKIVPKIIAESILVNTNPISSSLIDYKIWCFDGKVFGTWCCFNRSGFHADTEWHDLDWKFRPEWSKFTESYRNGNGRVPKPENYEQMLTIASKLSEGFPQVRIDLYNINGHIYFGEMTFTIAGGYVDFYSDDVLREMGEKTVLNIERI